MENSKKNAFLNIIRFYSNDYQLFYTIKELAKMFNINFSATIKKILFDYFYFLFQEADNIDKKVLSNLIEEYLDFNKSRKIKIARDLKTIEPIYEIKNFRRKICLYFYPTREMDKYIMQILLKMLENFNQEIKLNLIFFIFKGIVFYFDNKIETITQSLL